MELGQQFDRAQESALDAAAKEGVDFMTGDESIGQKEDMRPDPENSKLVRQGRMRAADGVDISTPKTIKANTYAQSAAFLRGYDEIRWDS